MNHLLVLLPEEFNCYTKLERKLDRISSSLMNFKITTNSPNELLKLYQEHNRDCIEVSYLHDWKSVEFTHAVIFKDDEIFNDDEEYIRLLNIPLRIIQIKITRVINIDTDIQYKSIRKNDVYEYIGRGSPWGNPYSMTTHNEEDRKNVIHSFKYDFDRDILLKAKKGDVYKLAGKRLGCFCKPFDCHGDILANFLNSWDDGE
ncbi:MULTISPECIES: DUF4326 domain-containing protein [Acinetobacter calcoaceticus/baumannii complex]|uniref:DUF4326 domain-containing protein n=2 Tax=Acinetobacter TaxID=469 RepID=UPI0023617EDA|nr:DUF4326 domain-containing protein [Acinetobacter nosocomialis]MDE9406993.1 DUF4326 domain-containing protein [Acinetobacter nosocomialis]HDG9763877.1 DUF4326 domain-containing protein [Acinetobacter nosocomialis]HDG9764025.1 DUF4326 domain-containing protein [Acinetobacter nosocomialis]